MPRLSNRAKETFISPFRKMLPIAAETKKRGIEVFHLNIGQPDFDIPESAWDAFRKIDKKGIPYGQAEGQWNYRKKLCSYYRSKGQNVKPEEIVVTTGASEGILFSLLTVADAGDSVLIPQPYYANYLGFCQMAGVKINPLLTYFENDFSLPDLGEIEKTISPETRAIILCNPNNPTGKVYTPADLKKLVPLLEKYDLFLIMDEAYREFVYDGIPFGSALDLPEIQERVIVIESASKRFNACGLRVGGVIARNHEIIEGISRYARLRLSPPVIGQWLAQYSLQASDEYFEKVLQEYDQRRNLLLEKFQEHPHIQVNAPEGGFYLFLKLPILNSDHFCEWLLRDFRYRNATVMLSPGTGFYSTEQHGKNEVRIAYVLDHEKLNRAADCLIEALRIYDYTDKKLLQAQPALTLEEPGS
jgi:aspartate aminotransferase